MKGHHQITRKFKSLFALLANPGLTPTLFPFWPVCMLEYSHPALIMGTLFLVVASVLTANPSLLSRSWDESSSISSGLSDASDNLSSEEFNASSSLNSLPTTPTASRRNSTIVVRASADALAAFCKRTAGQTGPCLCAGWHVRSPAPWDWFPRALGQVLLELVERNP